MTSLDFELRNEQTNDIFRIHFQFSLTRKTFRNFRFLQNNNKKFNWLFQSTNIRTGIKQLFLRFCSVIIHSPAQTKLSSRVLCLYFLSDLVLQKYIYITSVFYNGFLIVVYCFSKVSNSLLCTMNWKFNIEDVFERPCAFIIIVINRLKWYLNYTLS